MPCGSMLARDHALGIDSGDESQNDVVVAHVENEWVGRHLGKCLTKAYGRAWNL